MTTADPVYQRADLAALYDLFNPWMAVDDFYKARAVASGGPVLDVGCGTGMLACAIAAQGVEVVGTDPADGMLHVARRRPGGERVTWIHAAGQDLDLATRFTFAYMTGHAFQAVTGDAAAIALLRTVGGHLAPGGRFVFETRNPALRAWEDWTLSVETVESPAFGRVEETQRATYDDVTGVVTLDTRYRLLDTGEERAGGSRLRFVDHDRLAHLIAATGLRAVEWLGDWDGASFDPATSREIIAVVMA